MTYEEYKKQKLNNSNLTLQKNSDTTSLANNRYEEYKNSKINANTTPTNNNAQLNAYNTLLSATNVSTYNEMQPKATKFDVQINTSAGDTGSLNTPKYQEIKNKNDNNVVKGSINSFGANLVDATVDAGQFVKNAFKSEMKKEERDAIELLIKLENGFRGSKGQMSEQQAQNAINNLRKAHKLEGMTVQQLQDRLNGIVDWTYKENALEKATSDAIKKVNEENAELGKVGQFVTNAFGTVGRMGPTIASNIALPGSGTATMFASTAQARTEDLMDQGVNYKDAVVNGLLSGAMETGTEMLSGGISQKLTGIPALAKIGKYTDDIANPIIKTGLNVGGDILGEGLEEVASTAIQPFIDRITYNPNAQLATGEEMWSSFTQSILPTLLMQGGSVALQKVNEYNDAQKTTIENSNMPQTAKEQMIQALEEQKDKISAQINQITTQNNTNIAQTSPNNENISQNNAQNVSNLENTVQSEQSLGVQQSKEIPQLIQTFVENRNKTAPGLNIQFDNTLNTDGRIIRNPDGTRTISINPNSTRAYEFVVVHEMMHDLENTQEFQELSKYVKNRAITHEEFEKAKQAITEQYTKYYTENNLDMSGLNMDVETTNDMVARALGNPQFLNELAGNKPNVFMRLYNWIKNVAFDGNNTGKTFSERRADNKYLQELKNKFETAYNTSYKGNVNEYYSLKGRDKNGYPIYESDLIQEITNKEKIKYLEKQMKLLKEKPLFFNINGQKIKAYFDDYGVQKTTYGTAKGEKAETRKGFQTKEMLATDLYTIINNSKYVGEADEISNISNIPPKNRAHQDVRKWYTFENKINYNGEIYTVLTTVRKKDDGNYGYSIKFYENKKNNSVQAYSLKNFRDNTHSSYINSIPSNNNVVNNQYMQNSSNNTQNSRQGSFSLGQNLPKTDNQGRELTKGQQEYHKDNQLKDENGNIIRLYHGTRSDITTFRPSTGGEFGPGIYLTDRAETAEWYGRYVTKGENDPKVMEVYAVMKKPYIIDKFDYIDATENVTPTVFMKRLIKKGYDGIIGIESNGYDKQYIVFNPNQVKSIDNTNPTENPDIRYSQSNNEWQKYLDKNWNLMPNAKKTTSLMPSTEQLQAQDKKQGEEIYNELNMKKKEVNKTLKESIEDISNNTNANKVSYTNDFYRNMKNALGEQAGRELTEKFDNSKLNHVKTKQNLANELKTYIVDELGIKPDSEMSADVQRFGEKEITEAELKTKYPKTWQNIVKADKWFRSKYDELIDAINATREEIYPNVEERVNETKDALLKTYDLIKQAEKTGIAPYKIDQDIQDNIKRLDERIEANKEKIEEIEKANRPNYQKTIKYISLVEQLSLLEQNKNELERTIGKRYDEKVERLKQRAQRLSDTLNSEELWRGKRIPKRENYYRHFQEMSEGFKALHNIFTTPSEISSKLAGTSEYTKPKSKFLGLAQKRLTNETEYDAVKGFLNYLEPASYAINIDPFITELREITETIKKNTTETKNANKLTEYLDDFAGSLAGKTNPFDRPVQKVVGRKTMKAIEWTANRIKSNAVLGNINSSISQILNLPQVVAKIKDPIKMAQGVGDLVFNKGKYQDSQFIQERYHSDIMSQFNTKLTQQPKKFATWMLGALDEAVTKAGWNAVYRQAIEKGIDNPIKYADDTMRSLVAGRGIGERTLAQESKLTNLLMPFTVETGNYWRVMKDFVNEKDFGGILITFIVGWLLNRGIEAIGASGKTFDPIDAIYDAITEEDIGILQRIGRVGGEILSSMPMGQQIASLYPEYGADFGIFELPGREELFGSNDPTRFGTGNVLGKVFSNPVTGVALPWGGTQLRRTLEGANALIKGGDYKTNSKGEEQLKFPIDTKNMETSEKLLTAIQVLTLGKYATPNADKYFEDGALSKVETKGYKKALETGMSAEEFYNIMQAIEDIEIPKRKNKEGKDEAIPGARKKLIIDELNKTDLNDKQKKLMYDVFYKQEVK